MNGEEGGEDLRFCAGGGGDKSDDGFVRGVEACIAAETTSISCSSMTVADGCGTGGSTSMSRLEDGDGGHSETVGLVCFGAGFGLRSGVTGLGGLESRSRACRPGGTNN